MKEQIRNALKKVPIAYNLWHNFRLKINERNEKVKKTSYDKFALEVLNEVSQIVMTSGYKCVCMFGTLLGIVRDGQLLPWDDDIDFAFIPDENFPVEQFEKKLQAAGFWKYRTLVANGVLEEFSYKKECDGGLLHLAG